MTTETLMTETTATTTEGPSASQSATQASATGADQGGQQQQAGVKDTQGQSADASQTEGKTRSETKPEGAPEKYEFSTPEGSEALDSQVLERFSEVAKELNLPHDKAQLVLDKMAPTLAARQAEQIAQVSKDWAEASRNDKEFGGNKLDENLGVAKKALDTFGSPEFKTLLNESGLGNHPEVIRFLVRTGKATSEDRYVGGQVAQGSNPSAQRLYAASNMNP